MKKVKRVSPNLYRQTGDGRDNWLLRYERNGKSVWLGLGACREVTAAAARAERDKLIQLRRDGADPLAVRKAGKAKRAVPTFKQAAEKYLADNLNAFRSPVHRQQWTNTLASTFPKIGTILICDLEPSHIAGALSRSWVETPETARRLRGRIERILDAAKAAGWREGDNPAALNVLRHLLPRAKRAAVRHHAAMAVEDLPAFMAQLRERDSVSARALIWTILNWSRSNETRGAHADEVRGGVWELSAERMKSSRDFQIPLSRQALELIADRGGGLLFPGRNGKPLSNMAMTELLRGMRQGLTVHGFRSLARDWARLNGYPDDVAEAALSHQIANKVVRAYKRTDHMAERRVMMQRFADWV